MDSSKAPNPHRQEMSGLHIFCRNSILDTMQLFAVSFAMSRNIETCCDNVS